MNPDQTMPSPNEPPMDAGAASKREPFPLGRLIYAIAFGIIVCPALWMTMILGMLQFVTVAVTGNRNAELRRFSHLMARYIQEILEYATMARDEKPFPLGPFPKD